MRKLLLIALLTGGLTFAAVPRSDAQVFFSIGFGPGYYGGYYPYGYYPYRSYYRPYYGYRYYRPYYGYGRHRYYRHHRHHHNNYRY
jgi:hypothetical protein